MREGPRLDLETCADSVRVSLAGLWTASPTASRAVSANSTILIDCPDSGQNPRQLSEVGSVETEGDPRRACVLLDLVQDRQ